MADARSGAYDLLHATLGHIESLLDGALCVANDPHYVKDTVITLLHLAQEQLEEAEDLLEKMMESPGGEDHKT